MMLLAYQTLNSNLILLILLLKSIIDHADYDFKFQSDSINTQHKRQTTKGQKTLNSNLILLIPLSERSEKETC